ncbi:MAG: winged helix-turn-helix domain-containing protein [Candidatus Thorarchaeota archaeon]|jgi:DNA-binding MarR family transcriptional regulator
MAKTETDSEDLQPIADINRMIHEPARLMIMAYLYVVESADFLFLMRQTGLTRGNLSSHMSKLEAAGYVAVEKEFVDKIPRTLLRLSDEGRKAFQAYRESMKQVLDNLGDEDADK